jgi:hypothetical protein
LEITDFKYSVKVILDLDLPFKEFVVLLKSNVEEGHPWIAYRNSCCPHHQTTNRFVGKLILNLDLTYIF